MNNNSKGKVFFLGAGPGDPELITVKAARRIMQADVILADRLVSPEILSTYASETCEIISVGKQCRQGASTPQSTINDLMVRFSLNGKKVVRLKGGDVSIFSNILDELKALTEYNIPFEIIPGITAATGAAAYAGIPLTARNYSTGIRLLTSFKSEVISENYWKELAQTDDTLVFYMSGETLPDVIKKLTVYGIASEKLLAVIEQATTPQQQISVYNLYESIPAKKLASPALIIIGKVVSLHQEFGWVSNSENESAYFKEVSGLLVKYNNKEQELLTA